jgi:hypothetical protein
LTLQWNEISVHTANRAMLDFMGAAMRLSAFASSLILLAPGFQQAKAQQVTSIKVTQRTADVKYADTDDDFGLFVITNPDETLSGACTRKFPNLPSDERERGKTDVYTFNVTNCNLQLSGVTPSHIVIQDYGRDAWHPSNFCVQATAGGTQYNIVDGTWPNLYWFSQDPYDFPSPKVVRDVYRLTTITSVGGYCSGATSQSSASTITVTVRHWTYSTSTTPTCSGTVVVAGALQSAASGATAGATSFNTPIQWTGFATNSSGDQYYCDVATTTPSLRAGSWIFSYQVQNGSSSNCGQTLPLSSSAFGRINFTNQHASCSTGTTFP